MGHVQLSRLIPAPVSEVHRYITDLSYLSSWLQPDLEVEWPIKACGDKTTGGGDLLPIPAIRERAELALHLVRFGLALRVTVRIDEVIPEGGFTYRQLTGVFRSFVHAQHLRAHDTHTTLLTDFVDYRAPFGLLGALVDDLWLKRDLERILNQRLVRIEEFFNRPPSERAEPGMRE